MNKLRLHDNLTELIAITIESIENRLNGWPPYKHNWKERYQDAQNLPSHMIELNTFRITVDQITSNIMNLIEQELESPHKDKEKAKTT